MGEGGCAGLVDDRLPPKALIADDHVERGGIVGSIDIDEIEADLDPACLVEDADQVPRVIVVSGNMIGELLPAHVAHRRVGWMHDVGVPHPGEPALGCVDRLEAAQPETLGLDFDRARSMRNPCGGDHAAPLVTVLRTASRLSFPRALRGISRTKNQCSGTASRRNLSRHHARSVSEVALAPGASRTAAATESPPTGSGTAN